MPRRSAAVGRSMNLKPAARMGSGVGGQGSGVRGRERFAIITDPRSPTPDPRLLIFSDQDEVLFGGAAIRAFVGELLGAGEEVAAIGAAPHQLHGFGAARNRLP